MTAVEGQDLVPSSSSSYSDITGNIEDECEDDDEDDCRNGFHCRFSLA